VLARLLYPRLRGLILKDARQGWSEDVAASTARLQASLADLRAQVASLRRGYRDLLIAELNRRDAHELDAVRARLDRGCLGAHLTQAIDRAEVRPDPMPHLVVRDLFPAEFYALLLRAMPPVEVFQDRDPVKQDFEMGALLTAPDLSRLVWQFLDEELVGGVLAPALMRRLAPAVTSHYALTGGEEFGRQAAAIPHRSFAGRIQLRRPGYTLQPHLDPKRVVITGLVYFARPGDDPSHGTQLFSVDRPFVSAGIKTYFPGQHGLSCMLAATVPFTPNTLLAFVNSGGAHGATLPPDAALKERYAYQFYVKPDDGGLKRLLAGLPEQARAPWAEFLTPRG
jgi:hypothetical protein